MKPTPVSFYPPTPPTPLAGAPWVPPVVLQIEEDTTPDDLVDAVLPELMPGWMVVATDHSSPNKHSLHIEPVRVRADLTRAWHDKRSDGWPTACTSYRNLSRSGVEVHVEVTVRPVQDRCPVELIDGRLFLHLEATGSVE